MICITVLLDGLSLKDITPQNIQQDPTVKALIEALDPEFKYITKDIQQLNIFARLMLSDDLDEQTLDLLAYQVHADFYDLAATKRMKLEAVRNSILLHMKKGTVWAIKEALRQLDIEAEFVPWWENGGDPYTFSLRAIVGGEFYRTSGKDALIRNIFRAVNETKSAHSKLTELHTEIHDSQSMNIFAAMATALHGSIRINIPRPDDPEPVKLYHSSARSLQGYWRLGLHYERQLPVNIFAGDIIIRAFSLTLGVDLFFMQELLLRFEKRIFDRLDEQEKHFIDIVDARNQDIMLRLARIEKLLQWAGDDESIFLTERS